MVMIPFMGNLVNGQKQKMRDWDNALLLNFVSLTRKSRWKLKNLRKS